MKIKQLNEKAREVGPTGELCRLAGTEHEEAGSSLIPPPVKAFYLVSGTPAIRAIGTRQPATSVASFASVSVNWSSVTNGNFTFSSNFLSVTFDQS